ncbi:major histocompatibility complex class I-related gene protein-like [Protopterus annectens]|uniref:major histocompatibility complex class I-related gene protein-like n=1 Tax=Protopterus annectens TaxID=7888 RepID=UPI001CFAAC74|nr:major histocompatibility complex class I-related gene protein-like [Protopterus annectens]
MIVINKGALRIPSYINYWMLDESPVLKYDTDQKKVIFLKEYLNGTLQDDHWQSIFFRVIRFYNMYNNIFAEVMVNTNRTQGMHFFQTMFGCKSNADGTTSGFVFHAIDGETFMGFDKNSLQWTFSMQQAETMTYSWNRETVKARNCNIFLDETCRAYLEMILSYKQQGTEKSAEPKVKVYGRKSSNHTLISVSCHANEFSPYEIKLDWYKNGNLRVNDFQSSGILPNGDGMYQIKKTIQVAVHDKNRYSCQIDHESLEDGLTVNWDGTVEDGDGRGHIIAICIIILLIVLAAAALLFMRKKQGDK